ncbi:hypothetical protein VSVS12_00229 [Vibrio scophthalmi]|uniref:hypothetical protein n=1 Tax=Vibrio scophthalmi TaxID=45658 RepID=UPI0008097B4F|nr:hypothetical protein [Vibrio scophthalmi]ANS84053.1 hypothetical protein VSVS12_00229 [Vibrio scophthalmi]
MDKKEIIKHIDKINFQVYLAQTNVIKSYRNYKYNLDNKNGKTAIAACEDMIKSTEEELEVLMTKKRELEKKLMEK